MLSVETLVRLVFGLLIIGAVVGLLMLAVDKFPFFPADYKPTLKNCVIVAAIFVLILALLHMLNGARLFVP